MKMWARRKQIPQDATPSFTDFAGKPLDGTVTVETPTGRYAFPLVEGRIVWDAGDQIHMTTSTLG